MGGEEESGKKMSGRVGRKMGCEKACMRAQITEDLLSIHSRL